MKQPRPHQERAVAELVWRDIPGYEGLYQASSDGQIRSLDRIVALRGRYGQLVRRKLKGVVLSQTMQEATPGYFRWTVGLSRDGHCSTRLVHQLVMEAFVGPRSSGIEVAHGDGDPLNNRLDNLRYATPAENTADKVAHGTVAQGGRVAGAKLSEDQVRAIKSQKGRLRLRELAALYGVAESAISRIQNGVRWGHVQ
ncbi:NUMOD4 motif-containing HNH endonuclease [Sphingobium aromaticiconvertens]|uniref:NUMOD4 motif-containing HNH endonuclease n=1 Tax=Sphingobium aromaticiconvertens TaxID=365341 RepID=UPI0030187C33